MSLHDDITLFTVRDKPWSYRAEGNGNLVISLPKMGKILRFVKTEVTKSSTSDCHQVASTELQDGTANLRRLVSFIGDTMAPLLGRKFVQSGEIVRIAADELLRLNDELHPLRPESRRHKTLGQKDTLALLQPDHCSPSEPSADLIAKGLKPVGSVVTIEIKPKMGFLSMRSEIRAGSADDVLTSSTMAICKYHLMQLWKLKQGRIAHVSGYCPLDLFSGCRSRMTNSLRQLLLNPQNNFRIFQNGALVYGENLDVVKQIFPDVTDSNLAVDRLCHLVIEALLFDHPLDDVARLPYSAQESTCQCKTYNGNPFEAKGYYRHTCERMYGCAMLPQGCALNRLLTAQMLHTSDARSLRSAYHRIQSQFEMLPPEVVTSLLYGGRTDLQSAKLNDVPDVNDDDVRQIRRYLLSSTARDCSIMLKLCQLENGVDAAFDQSLLPPGQIIVTDARTSFLCSLAFVDLDWKPLSRLPKHADEEAALCDHWTSRQLHNH